MKKLKEVLEFLCPYIIAMVIVVLIAILIANLKANVWQSDLPQWVKFLFIG